MNYRAFALILPLLASCSFSISSKGDGSSVASASSTSVNSSAAHQETRTLEVYAINDFHGQIKEEGDYPGIENVGSYFKRRGQEDNTILISSGDMFQGSLESNYNSGHLLADVMNECRFDAMSLGNHDFDWGLEALKANKDRVSEAGYQTPYLCANLYDYSNGQEGTTQLSQYGGEYVIKEQENGLRVGIIGAIGRNQITSITSSCVSSVCFKDPVQIVKSVSDELRNEKNCDVVILSLHSPQSDMTGRGITSVSPNSGKRYVDLVLCAHSHAYESKVENQVIFTQNHDKGENASHVTLTVSESGEVSGELETVDASDMKLETQEKGVDEAISSLVSSYGEESDAVGKKSLGTLNGTFSKSGALPNLVAEAILQETLESYPEVELAMVNVARESLYSGSLTYSDLFSAIPFDNEIYIIETSGKDLIKEAGYNYIAREREEGFAESGTYKIAVIDYLALHQSIERVYNYFPNLNIVGKLTQENGDRRGYRDIAADYIIDNKTVSSIAYSSDLDRYNGKNLASSVSF